MKRVSIKNYLLITYRLLLAGVFSAMLFSSGEGIRLLPFSDYYQGENVFAEQAEKKFNSYTFSVNNSGNRRSNLAPQSSPNLKNHSIYTGFSAVSFRQLIAESLRTQKAEFNQNKLFASNGVLSEPSDRAPPVV